MEVEDVQKEHVLTNTTVSISQEDLLTLKIQQSVKSIIKKEGFQNYTIIIKMLTPDGGSYLGMLYEVDIKGKIATGNKETNLFMKIIIPNDQMTVISLPGVYQKELFYYTDLKKVFTEIQDEVNLPVEEKFKIVNCFDESKPEALIFENMNKKGFKTMNRQDIVTLKFAKLAIEQMAKFHSMSFVLEERRPKYFEMKIKTLDSPYNFDDDFRNFVHITSRSAINCLDGEKKTRLEDFVPKIYEKYPRYLTDNKRTKCCLCHGDFRSNNILMKEIDGNAMEVIPIDYQLIFFGYPVIDFLYFIFTSTNKSFRKAHLSGLKDHYHNTMRKFLKYFDLNIDAIYPREEFEKSYEERLDYGLMAGLWITPLLLVSEEGIPDLTQPLAEVKFDIDNDEYKERVVGLVEDFIEWGCL